ncbi:rRNA maturation RNase YbeY [Legionella londiniensis]|uniref:Endoribonuclease YbeY n=1 Tax=Legionella londiniensis TaxID=45068 RepID=A0A0W0VM15_9GAMM|nr:rRNA maturation RNase YbeY [Legionella londiniensis]KTD20825.1 metal dependent hydrolase [Legionella londiniensis]STX93098.1 metal-dependent hydrolase [Legionella londiniensis]
MTFQIDIQHASKEPAPVDDNTLTNWVQRALHNHKNTAELGLRMVDPEEMIQLNHLYRHQNKETNVLAFPANIPSGIELEHPLLGDVVICPSVLKKESESLQKPLTAHWAHIVIHGVLHLLGYDHIKEEDAKIMQAIEVRLLLDLGFENPYSTEEDEIE